MMFLYQRAGALALGLSLAAASPAWAQTAEKDSSQTATKTPSKDSAKESVTVAAERPSVQVLADRTVYTLDNNIQSATSSVSDILRNLPSVNVDIDGNVSLRGDSSVTVLIDGKKSPLLAGNLADALQQIPASMIERVEIITNPSAEFRAEGSGGIINIVLKKNKEPTSSGILRVSLGNQGRVNASATGNLTLGRVHLSGGYGERRDRSSKTNTLARSDNGTDDFSQQILGNSNYAGRWTYLSGTADITQHDNLSLSGSYNKFGGTYRSNEHDVSSSTSSDTMRDGLLHWANKGDGGQISYSHKLDDDGQTLSLDLSDYGSWGRNNFSYTTEDTASGVADYWQSRQALSRLNNGEIELSYTLPFDKTGSFKAGYDVQFDNNRTDNTGLLRDSAQSDWVSDSTFTNLFSVSRTIHAGYASYERKIGDFDVMGGIRLEQDFLTTNLVTTGEVHDTATTGFYPSLDVSYALSDTEHLKLSYSRRMNRPMLTQLNPARISYDSYSASSGNPLLKPEQIDSFDVSYHRVGDEGDFLLSAFYKATYNGFTSVYQELPDNVLLTTTDNLAHRLSSGLESNISYSLFDSLNVKSSASLFYSAFNPGSLGIGHKQSGLSWNIKGGLDWHLTADDQIQFNANYNGKQRLAQGYTDPTLSEDVGLRHRFDGSFTGVATINNLFNAPDSRTVIDSDGLYQVSNRRVRGGRVFFLGLIYTFGGAKDTASGDENSGGMGGAP